jgi:hypothetical protein
VRLFAAAAAGLALGLAPLAAVAEPCARCFAVFVMPDTQGYVLEVANQPAARSDGARHLANVGEWICANRSAWREPRTGKEMPLAIVLQLGDLTQSNRPAEWQRIDALFDRFDAPACDVPYLVVPGNHDRDRHDGSYALSLARYEEWFGAEKRAGWLRHRCASPPDCGPEQWFLGGGDPVRARSRNVGREDEGPPTDEPGRHRAALIHTPGGGRMLFVGLDLSFDFDPPPGAKQGDDLDWVERLLALFPGVPSVLVNHYLFTDTSGNIPGLGATYDADTWDEGMDVWRKLVLPHPQVFLALNGHWLGSTARNRSEARPDGTQVHRLLRNYQAVKPAADPSYPAPFHGDGWNVIAAFDPDAGELRVRSYRIAPDAPRVIEMDQGCPANPEACELTIPWRPASERR